MQRRSFFTALATLSPVPLALAEHGWETYDLAKPLYLEGEVTTIIWADPHSHLELLHRSGVTVPADLLQRPIPKQRENVDTAALLRNARVPPAGREIWRVELPSLALLSKWDVRRPKIQQVIGVVGYPGPQLLDTPTVRAEILFIGGKAYPMRSDPA